MKIADLVRAMAAIAPPPLAESWDNVGLLVGDPEGALHRVLLTIDATLPVIEEARRSSCEAIVSYHPPIFGGLKRVLSRSPAYELVRSGIAAYSPHTALDAADGGTNDVLADRVGMLERAPLRRVVSGEGGLKLVTFVPAAHVEAVSRALFQAGAGHIGRYSHCSFRSTGTGTFFGGEGTSPAVGQAGRHEEAAELRLETVVAPERIEDVVLALRASHPYEEVAFDLVRLAAAPARHGAGRVGRVVAAPLGEIVDRFRLALGLERVLLAGSSSSFVTRVAVCAGSGGELLDDAIAAGAQLFITGELRHHDTLRALGAGVAVACTLHSASERCVLEPLAARLTAALPGLGVSVSLADREPFGFLP